MSAMRTDSVTRYVVTHLDKDLTRTLFDPGQGQYTYETREQAQARIHALTTNNDLSRYVPPPHSLEVRACECWPVHFDPKEVWFDIAEEAEIDDLRVVKRMTPTHKKLV